MPTYEYRREDGTVFETFQGINDPALTHCPDTGQPVQRIITGGGGVVYKGSGWYVTDYKPGGGASGDAARRSSEGAAEGDAAGGRETAGISTSGGEAGSTSPAKESSSGTSS